MSKVDKIGLMNDAYFVGKPELFKWINEFFSLNVTKIEHFATGSIHCQIMDVIYPGSFPFKTVKWNAKYDYDWISNWRILKAAFDKNGVKKHFDIDRLVKARPLDNLEFL